MHSKTSKLTMTLLAMVAALTSAKAADQVTDPTAAAETNHPARPLLSVGDPAPKLAMGRWIQGDPVTEFATNKVYIVEFWATWCGPCKASIPHLNELYQQFKDKDVIVIGQDCWERDDALPEPFVKKMGEKMTYRVALDDKTGGGRGAMAGTWMAASGQNGIPSAFIVDRQGKIAWMGHPMKMDPGLLEDILAGKHDLQKAAKIQAVEREKQVANQALASQVRSLQVAFNRQLSASQWDEAEATLIKLDSLAHSQSPGTNARPSLMRMRLLLARKDLDGAVKIGTAALESSPRDISVQLTIAAEFANLPELKGPALDLAEKAAQTGYASGGQIGNIFLSLLARVKMIQGDQAKAVEYQTKMLAELSDKTPEATRRQYQAVLEAYQAGKLPPASASK